MPAKKKDQPVYTCCQCGRSFTSQTQFYKSYSNLYAANERIPICRECLVDLFNSYVKKFNSTKTAMERICMSFDLYYNDDLFESCDDGTEASIGNYVKRLNLGQYKGKTFDDTIDDGFVFNAKEEPKQENGEEDEPEISPESIKRWGPGFDAEDYESLNNHYNFLKNANPNCDSNQEIFIVDLCYTKMQQMKAVREGRVDDYNKLTESYRKSFQQAGLKTVRDASINEEFSLGITAETIEKNTPAEYYKNKGLYKDFDGIGEYIKRFMLRPLINMQFGKKERDYEFYVKDDENGEDEYEDV